jgi:hypothetical protein
MPQLGYPRIGWENENLASYILSRFSFISRPHSVADDAGTDFFCTLFRRITKKKNNRKVEVLIPDNSFAIQIKSDRKRIPATKKIGYLNNLEIPFFIGVINRQQASLIIYSGAWIPHFFALNGSNIKLKLKVCDNEITSESFSENLGEGNYLLKLPKVCEISTQETPSDLNEKAGELSILCSSIHGNIASKKNNENLYSIPGSKSEPMIIAGSGSLQVFRTNFYKRLTEVFLNLIWSHENAIPSELKEFIRTEFKVYGTLFQELRNLYGIDNLPHYFNDRYQQAQKYFDSS